MTDDELRRALSDVRGKIGATENNLSALRKREAILLAEITPRTERCQECRGGGTIQTRDWQSGYTVSVRCPSCSGTGRWKEPV